MGEKDEEAEAEKGQTLAERKKLRKQQEKLKEEEAGCIYLSHEQF